MSATWTSAVLGKAFHKFIGSDTLRVQNRLMAVTINRLVKPLRLYSKYDVVNDAMHRFYNEKLA